MIPTQTNLQPVYWVTSAPVSPAMNPGGLAHEDELLDRTTAEREEDSVVLLECAIMALATANWPWAWAYEQRLGVGAQQSDRQTLGSG
jgi:hypothetical protein